ncbi:hypothetical protein [Streptomyces sp. NPDC000410]|uniref:hypothetical protein n=1 Tax=Streptomyces sp. NPDC000410 TaxID=3154254 RepID=UPI00331BAAE8
MTVGLAALMVPEPVAVRVLMAPVTAVGLQVRGVEETYLAAVPVAAYVDHTTRTGRFLPGVGRRTG